MKLCTKKAISLGLIVVMVLSQGLSLTATEITQLPTGDGTTCITEEGMTTYFDEEGNEVEMVMVEEEKVVTSGIKKTESINELSTPIAEPIEKYDEMSVQEVQSSSKLLAVPGEYLVKFKSGVTQTAQDKLLVKYALTKVKTLQDGNLILVKEKPGTKMATSMAADTAIERLEPNYLYYPDGDVNSDSLESTAGGETVPMATTYEPYYGNLWGLYNFGQTIGVPGVVDMDIDALEAMEITTGSKNVVVGVIDTGVDINHPDLAGNIYTNLGEIPNNHVDDDHNGYIDDVHGWDFYNDDATVFDPLQVDDHGTHVAGTIAAAINGVGVQGVAPNVTILPIKFMGPDGGNLADAIDAIFYANRMGCRIVNNSWTGEGYSEFLETAIELTNPICIASAGNNGRNIDLLPIYPASYDLPNIITVAAIDNQGNMPGFSNYGVKSVDIAAPGVNILSTVGKDFEAGAVIGSSNTLYASFGLESLKDRTSRASYMGKVLNYLGITGTSKVLIVDDDESYTGNYADYSYMYQFAMMDNRVQVNFYEASDPEPNLDTFSYYDLVIWFTGDATYSAINGKNIHEANQADLMAYLDKGGKLFVSGTQASSMIEDTVFYKNYLHADFLRETSFAKSVFGAAGTVFDGVTYQVEDTFMDLLTPSDALGKVLVSYPAATDYTNALGYLSGTSMAAPHVAGIAALLLSQKARSTETVVSYILESGEPLASTEGKTATGCLANAYKALKYETTLEARDNDIPGVPYAPHVEGTLDRNTDLDDVYRVDLKAGETINIVLDGDAGTDFDLYLFDPMASNVMDFDHLPIYSEADGSFETIEYMAEISGTYYVDIYAAAGAGGYILDIQIDEPAAIPEAPTLVKLMPWVNNLHVIFANSSDPNVLSYQIKVSDDGVNYETKATVLDSNLVTGTASVQLKIASGGMKYVCITTLGVAGESEPSNVMSAEVPVSNSNYRVEDTSPYLQVTGQWTQEATTFGDQSAIATTEVGAEIFIPAHDANNLYIRLLKGPEMGVVEITAPGGLIYQRNLYSETPGEVNTGFMRLLTFPETGYKLKCISGKVAFESLSVEGVDYEAPSVPTDLVVESEDGVVMLDWSRVPEVDVASYTVGRLDENEHYESFTVNGTTTSYIDSNVEVGKYYFYAIFAVDHAKNVSGQSEINRVIVSPKIEKVTIRHESTEATYTGTWYTHLTSKNSSGSALYAKKSTDAIIFEFYGSGIAWIGSGSESKGIASVAIDGGELTVVDTYRPTTLYQQTLFTVQNLPQGRHTITIKPSGFMNLSATGKTIHVDAFDVTTIADSVAPSSPASLESTLNGSVIALTWMGVAAQDLAGYNIYRKDLYTGVTKKLNSALYKDTAYQDLTGTESALYQYTITAVDFNNNESIPSPISEIALPLTSTVQRVEEPAATFTGSWTVHTKTLNSENTAMMSTIKGDTATFTFQGTGIRLIGLLNSSRGIAKVTVDGVVYNVDCYRPVSQYQQTFFQLTGLSAGSHTISVEVTGRKSPLATNKVIHLDAFEVIF